MSAISAIANDLVTLCKTGQNLAAIEKYYAPNVVSVEAADMNGTGRRSEGFQAVLGKSQWWIANHEVHSGEADGPFAHGDDRFAVVFTYDVTFKPTGLRHTMKEVAVYTVVEGKIALEEFFYGS